jgi:hypothetical protein
MLGPSNERNHLRGGGAVADGRLLGAAAASLERSGVRQRDVKELRGGVFISINVLFALITALICARALDYAGDAPDSEPGSNLSTSNSDAGTAPDTTTSPAPRRFDAVQNASNGAGSKYDDAPSHEAGSAKLPSAQASEAVSPLLVLEHAYSAVTQAPAPNGNSGVQDTTAQPSAASTLGSREALFSSIQPPPLPPSDSSENWDGEDPVSGDANDVAPTITSGPAAAVNENTAPSTVVYSSGAVFSE